MKVLILMGSPRKQGNTAALLKPVQQELEAQGVDTELLWLYDYPLNPCVACRTCQKDWQIFGCVQQDQGQIFFYKLMAAEVLVLATPIYCWYCTPPMKTLLDRMVYGMNKYYGDTWGPSLWQGKGVALVTTCGYPVEKGCDLLEEGIRRYCKHSQLRYLGSLSARQRAYGEAFMDGEKQDQARAFARRILQKE